MRMTKSFDDHWYAIIMGFLFFIMTASFMFAILSSVKIEPGLFLAGISLVIATGIFIVMMLFDKKSSKKIDFIQKGTKQISEINARLLRIDRLLRDRALDSGGPPTDLYCWLLPNPVPSRKPAT